MRPIPKWLAWLGHTKVREFKTKDPSSVGVATLEWAFLTDPKVMPLLVF